MAGCLYMDANHCTAPSVHSGLRFLRHCLKPHISAVHDLRWSRTKTDMRVYKILN